MKCVTCLGEGRVYVRLSCWTRASGFRRSWIECPTCRGTGEAPVTAKAADDLAALWRDTGENGGA